MSTPITPILKAKRSSSASVLLSPAPLHALLEQWDNDATIVRRWTGATELTKVIECARAELATALAAAAKAELFVTIDQLSKLTQRPPSTLTRICREHEAAVGARKLKGVWLVYWPTFEAATAQAGFTEVVSHKATEAA